MLNLWQYLQYLSEISETSQDDAQNQRSTSGWFGNSEKHRKHQWAQSNVAKVSWYCLDLETKNSKFIITYYSIDPQFSCSVCNKKFASNMTVRAHEKTHLNNEYACDICGSKFRVKAYITSHMQKVHMKIFRFICNVEGCTEKFVHRELFNYHIKKHLNIRNFACKYCGKTFIARATCQIHEKTHSRVKISQYWFRFV